MVWTDPTAFNGGSGWEPLQKLTAQDLNAYVLENTEYLYDRIDALATDGVIKKTSMPSGTVLQHQIVTKTGAESLGSIGFGSTSGDITGLSLTITPVYSNSKIIITGSVTFGMAYGDVLASVWRKIGSGSASKITSMSGDSAGVRQTGASSVHMEENGMATLSLLGYDEPGTTNTLTYTVRAGHDRTSGTTIYVNQNNDDLNQAGFFRGISTLMVTEVKA